MDVTLTRIQRQAAAEVIRVTQHAQQEMDAEEITLDEVLAAIANGQIWRITPSTGVVHVACSMVALIMVVLYMSFVLLHKRD